MTIIAPSVLSADYTNLSKDINELNNSKAEWIHYDVMDGHFVPNLTFGPDILKAINKLSNKYIDVHIMVDNPIKTIDYFNGCHIDMLTFHYEAAKDNLDEVVNYIRSKGYKVGISIKPATEPEVLNEVLSKVDMVLVMSVEPGFGGQKFMSSALDKLDYLYNYKVEHQLNYLLEIDGGINDTTAPLAIEHHCDVLVAGSYAFKHPEGLAKACEILLG